MSRPKGSMQRHSSDVVSLVAGLIFLGIAGRWALGGTDLVPGNGGWLIPLILIAAGVAGLLSARQRRSDAAEDAPEGAYTGDDLEREGGQA